MSAMKKIILGAALAAIVSVSAYAQEEGYPIFHKTPTSITVDDFEGIELTTCADPTFDWQQYDEKTGKALVTGKGLELESKKDGVYCMSFCELPISVKDDNFVVRFVMTPNEISDDKPFGVVYDVENEDNYRMLLIMKKSFQMLSVKDSKYSVVKKGIYKLKHKSKKLEIEMMRLKDHLYFYVDGLEILKSKCPEMENPNFGFVVSPKVKIVCNGIGFIKETPEDEEETDTN